MTTRKITTSISTPSLSSFDINFKNDKNSFSESSLLKHRSSLKMDTFSVKYYTATQKSNKNKLYEVINNKDSRSAFYDFLGTQFCVENLLCWEAIEKFKKMDGSPSEMYTTAEEIYSLFIRDNSRYEINIYSKQKDRLKETLKHTFIIPEFSDGSSTSSTSSSPSPSTGNNDGGNALTHSFSNLSLNNSLNSSQSAPTSQTNTPNFSNNLYNNIVQSSTFITNSPIQTDTFPKRKKKLRFRKLISKTLFSEPSNNNSSNTNNSNSKYSNINNIPPTLNPTNQSEIIHPPLSPNITTFDGDCFSRTNSSNCVVGSCSDDSFVVILGNSFGNRKSGSAYSSSDSSDGEYEEFDRNNIKFGIAKCQNLFNDIQDELEQMMIENSLGEFLKKGWLPLKNKNNDNNNDNNNNNNNNNNNQILDNDNLHIVS
ncbi:hypothetical protein DICPUDRAFT_158398 [Dictyostelium purpureum]|uniref:RGS domain-containing protein n=1 Tax=Dictyostelium purpureum TaxID=5786 RepID=F1A1I9_DICPU|nr:uncharacterized protein DICPUDRAFT_158398 [Dictyostelium purpureum]EGC29952.1 hypothetical protein DICPUDRAFT_158398 [Dictyostelium purpureum]|eukprot:XP_003293533.1 hypothetical protein DICPUDRAFT_158398 [Dictyostelium purpureum]